MNLTKKIMDEAKINHLVLEIKENPSEELKTELFKKLKEYRSRYEHPYIIKFKIE